MIKIFPFILSSNTNKVKLTSYGITKICLIIRRKKLCHLFFPSSSKRISHCFICLFLVCFILSLGAWSAHKPPYLQRSRNAFSSGLDSKISTPIEYSIPQLKEEDLTVARQFLEELQHKKDSQIKSPSEVLFEVSNKHNKSTTQPSQTINTCPQNRCLVHPQEKLPKINSFSLNDKRLIVFVSFSLGDITLQQLYRDTQKIGGQLVMRGLYRNSFRQTQKKIQELKIIVDIDPTLFERFQIQEVPTFVIANDVMNTEMTPDYDKLKGNVSVSYALGIFEQAGTKEARILLNKLREATHE